MSKLWINGQLIDKADARVSPFDHGFLYGDGVWEPFRVFGGKLFRPDDHIQQLFRAASVLRIDIPLSQADVRAAIETTVKANNRTEGYIRAIVTRGPGTLGPDPRKIDPQVIIIAEEYHPFPLELYQHGINAVTAETNFRSAHPADCVRMLGLPILAMAKAHALRNGCLEAVLLDAGGYVRGATEGDVFAVRAGTVVGLQAGLPDAMRAVVFDLAAETGLPKEEGTSNGNQLEAFDEVFLAGTSCGIVGIVQINGTPIGSGTEGPVTRTIREGYRKLTRDTT